MSDSNKVHLSIIKQINTNKITVYNNEMTLFQSVFMVLKTSVPLTDDQAFELTKTIHNQGSAVVYEGNMDHCIKISQALKDIEVRYQID